MTFLGLQFNKIFTEFYTGRNSLLGSYVSVLNIKVKVLVVIFVKMRRKTDAAHYVNF